MGPQGDVTVVVEHAQGHLHPLAGPQAGQGEQLDDQAPQRRGIGRRRPQQPGGRGVVEEAGQRFLGHRQVVGDGVDAPQNVRRILGDAWVRPPGGRGASPNSGYSMTPSD